VNGAAPHPDLLAALEAILFVAEEPVELAELARALEVSLAAVRGLVDRLAEASAARGVRVQRQNTRVRLVSAPEAGVYVHRFLGARSEQRLSHAALETLAIIAYRQPVTRGDIEDIRGVGVGTPVVKQLEDRGWIEAIGYRETPGRPALYATTKQFLDDLGLESLQQLPTVEGAAPLTALLEAASPEQSSLLQPDAAAQAELVMAPQAPAGEPAAAPEADPSTAAGATPVPEVPMERQA
jgi:segregation and condensation protein B